MMIIGSLRYTLHGSHQLPMGSGVGWLMLWFAMGLSNWAGAQTTPFDTTQPATHSSMKTGFAVFGNSLGIHGHDSLVVRGNILLDRADIAGDGVLVIQSNCPQKLVSRHSQLNHIYLHNPTRVAVHGDLHVKKSLTVEMGTVDLTNGTLIRDQACQTRLLNSGRLQNGPILTSATPCFELTDNQTVIALLNISMAVWQPIYGNETQLVRPTLDLVHSTEQTLAQPFPPPEVI